MGPQRADELELPYLNTLGLDRVEARAAVEAARAQHWLARTEMGYSVMRLDDVTAILRDQRFHSALSVLPSMEGLDAERFPPSRRQSILTMEGDGHARLR
ncbi:MAG TPA: hypothetical protein VGF87_05880, partial [Acidimicrobiales bacterium]